MELVESVNGIQIENLIYLSKQKYRTLYSLTAQTFKGFKGLDQIVVDICSSFKSKMNILNGADMHAVDLL